MDGVEKNKQIQLDKEPRGTVSEQDGEEKSPQGKKKHKKRKKKLFRKLLRLPLPAKIAIVAVLAGIAFATPAFIIPYLSPKPETQYTTAADLEEVVNISRLSTVNFYYTGVAAKYKDKGSGSKSQKQVVDFRIKYTAHVSASFDMEDISFSEPNQETGVITVYLPEPLVDVSGIDTGSISYLPEGKKASMADVLQLCREDAVREVNEDAQIKERAYSNLEDTIRALTYPLIGQEYTLEFVREEGTFFDSDDGQTTEQDVEDTEETAEEADNEA